MSPHTPQERLDRLLQTFETPSAADVRRVADAALAGTRGRAASRPSMWLAYATLAAAVGLAVLSVGPVVERTPPPGQVRAADVAPGAGPVMVVVTEDGSLWLGNRTEPARTLPAGVGIVVFEGGLR
jgi:hypothetical protein